MQQFTGEPPAISQYNPAPYLFNNHYLVIAIASLIKEMYSNKDVQEWEWVR